MGKLSFCDFVLDSLCWPACAMCGLSSTTPVHPRQAMRALGRGLAFRVNTYMAALLLAIWLHAVLVDTS